MSFLFYTGIFTFWNHGHVLNVYLCVMSACQSLFSTPNRLLICFHIKNPYKFRLFLHCFSLIFRFPHRQRVCPNRTPNIPEIFLCYKLAWFENFYCLFDGGIFFVLQIYQCSCYITKKDIIEDFIKAMATIKSSIS